jgi:Abnormal spindle-like microcephaly-assoc'd, ASPM-SPD-2-Hydin
MSMRLVRRFTSAAVVAGLLTAVVLADSAGATPGGPVFAAPTSIDATNSMHSVSCSANGSVCAAADTAGNIVTSSNGGAAWSAPVAVDAGQSPNVACVDSGVCVAVAFESPGNAYVSNAITSNASPPTWTTTEIDPTFRPTSIGCQASGLCVVGDNGGNAMISTNVETAGPATWSAPTAIDSHRINGVSCPTATLCVLVDSFGNAVVSTNPAAETPTWTTARIDPNEDLDSVSCTTQVCAAMDSSGVLISSNPGAATPTWSPRAVIANFTSGASTSCIAGPLCMTISNGDALFSGNVLAAQPSWTYAVPPATSLTAISCVDSGRCVAVDGAGDAVIGLAPLATLGITGTGAFASTQVGTTSERTFSLTNSGGGTLNITTAALTGAGASAYSILVNDCDGAALAPAASCSVTVQFAPTTATTSAATLTVTSDAASSPDTVSLSGTGTPAPTPPPPTTVTVTNTVTTPGPTVFVKTPPVPSSLFKITKATANRSGVITLELTLPDAGRFTAAPKTTLKGKTTAYGASASGRSKSLATVTVTIKPGHTAVSVLHKLGRLSVALAITFTATGGTKHSEQTTVKVASVR